ncbi:hypothetical protein [Streptomyces sp. NPDC059708]|uniref:hypothetical protein n=1 Tax=Streptomyces sp. NPDC059708 TaxID=3346916 RepID=UPI003683075E
MNTRTPRRRRGAARRPRFALAVTAVFFALLYLPVAVVVLFSFNGQKSLTVLHGTSLRWYAASSTTTSSSPPSA